MPDINRSPRAAPLPDPEWAEPVTPPEMRADFFERRSMSPWRRRREGLTQPTNPPRITSREQGD